MRTYNSSTSSRVTTLVVKNPGQNISNGWKYARSCKEDTKIFRSNRVTRSKKDVADAADKRAENDHQPTLLRSVCDPRSEAGDDERHEVRRGGQALRIDGGEAHLLKDGGKKDWQTAVRDVAREIHQLLEEVIRQQRSTFSGARGSNQLTAVNQALASIIVSPISLKLTLWPTSTEPSCRTPRALATTFSSSVRNLALAVLSGIK